ncbi:hypothetical protein ACFC08_23820 [Streptomyces sp. NPDC056112]|uniref:hypothetical protein n=1 Tax=Streptomyces sp. NPDC056112 TaxID=3345715 RepID=UPI0035DB073B
MPRGRHRHSPPLHRLLPSSAIAGVAVVCALGPWAFTDAVVLRLLAGTAAVTAVLGAFVMRRWDAQAGRRVADLTRARASDEWRFEERVAELETDLEESRELRGRLEQKLRARRTELAGLRNEHASLLRRYATAETERATALEGRRLLEIETGSDMLALPAAPTAAPDAAGTETHESAAPVTGPTEKKPGAAAPAVFSPEGSELYLRAEAALSRLGKGGARAARTDEATRTGSSEESDTASETDPVWDTAVTADGDTDPDPARETGTGETPEHAAATTETAETAETTEAADPSDPAEVTGMAEPAGPAGPAEADGPAGPAEADGPAGPAEADGPAGPAGPAEAADPADRSTAADSGEQAAPVPSATAVEPAKAAPQSQLPSGHFTVPTAVAVVPAAPARRPLVEGGFDFFGTKKEAADTGPGAVRNDDLVDVVGQEALALHKAEAESQYKPADADAPAAGRQIIDLTAHDETERIDLPGLRTAAS